MNPILTIDVGNTHPHGGLFDDGVLKAVYPEKQLGKLTRENYFKTVICQVGKSDKLVRKFKEDALDLQRFKKQGFFLDMPVNYSLSLGDDRLYQAYYIFKKHVVEKGTILLIDSGTFTTMDIVDGKGFRGGHIFPGLSVFLDCYRRGHRLFDLKEHEITTSLPELPENTKEAIVESCKLYYIALFERVIRQYSGIQYVVLTGGNGLFIRNLLKNLNGNTAIEFAPHLIHYALYYIARQEYGK
ncbi:MAG: type III pantothenate kinase [Halobacteriovoraceae bacterium]|nr:type III pantothenate kinase [Halobacteriovoraceae bacterium]